MTRHSNLPDDDRGVSEVLGAILVFALVLIVISLIQVWAVPAANQQIEFDHSQRAVGDVQQFATVVNDAATDDSPGSSALQAGVRYPPRLFLVNPPAPAGTVETSRGTVVVNNARATGIETRDYLAGDDHTFDSVRLSYRPNYNEYQNAPTTYFEGWTLYNQFQDNAIVYDHEGLLSGRTIRLTMLDGQFSRSSQGTVTLPANPISAPVQTVNVRGANASNPVSVRLTTGLSAEKWTSILGDEPFFDGATQVDPETVDIEFAYADASGPITYKLRMSKVGVGSNAEVVEPHYLTDVGEPTVLDSAGTVTVQVRDRYNNPVSGAEVQFQSNDAAIQTPVVTTDEDGLATGRFDGATDVTANVTATTTVASGPRQTERGTVSFENIPTNPTGASEINPNDPSSLTLQSAEALKIGTGADQKWVVDVTFRNRGPEKEITESRVNSYISNTISNGKLVVPTRADVEGVDHEIAGEYEDVTSEPGYQTTIPDGDTVTYRFEFSDSGGDNHQPDAGEFFVYSLRFEDGGTTRYFVQPRVG